MAVAPISDIFDAYFRRADFDRDGRISGEEAVAFFRGSGLPIQVLSQVWAYADQGGRGFLGRPEFYNALKLVTVAQMKRELTPDIVKAALYGPDAAKIPAPQINFAAMPSPQLNTAAVALPPQIGAVAPTPTQTLGLRGPQLAPSASMNQQHFPSQESKSMGPSQVISGSPAHPMQGVASQGFHGEGTVAGLSPPTSSIPSDWDSGKAGGAPLGVTSQLPNRGTSPLTFQDGFGRAVSRATASLPPRPQAASRMMPSGPSPMDSKALDISRNGFGGDVFSATPSQSKQDSFERTLSGGNVPVSSVIVPVPAVIQPSVRPSALDSSQSLLMAQPIGGQLQQVQLLVKQNQQVSSQTTSSFTSSGISLGVENSTSSQSQQPWPNMTQTDVQKYTKVFMEVDRDGDGKITGEQVHDLFLSWRLPREVLKQVWDLSDQDNDSMLSLREFCIALYLMERYREGRPLSAVPSKSIMFDFPTTDQPTTGYSNSAWGFAGSQQQQGLSGFGANHITLEVGVRPPMPTAVAQVDAWSWTNQQKSRVPVLEKHLVDQLSKEEQNSLSSKFQDATEADKKVEELENEILDSKEKVELYRAKMQELVLYKSRCDNRLNEITERASADKREVESLAKKYEEKYKQFGDVASKLTIEESTFREMQERKMELYQAIVKMEQDGSADGILQVRADRIRTDLDKLVKALNECCKKYGLCVKPTALVELPFGWQPGIQEGTADWDEDWDKFEDEGFTFLKELTLDVQNVIAPSKPKSTSAWNEKASAVESPTAAFSPYADVKSEKLPNISEQEVENRLLYNRSEDDSARSAPGSPMSGSAIESPSRGYADSNFGKTTSVDGSPHDNETQSDDGGAGSVLSGGKSVDEPTWWRFDSDDDIDSVCGFNSIGTAKEMDWGRYGENSFFGSGDLGPNSIRTG